MEREGSMKKRRTSSADEQRVSQLESGALDAGQRDRQRLEKGTLLPGDGVRNSVQPGSRVKVAGVQITHVSNDRDRKRKTGRRTIE